MKVGLAAHVAESNQKVAFQLQLIAQYCSVGSHYKVLLCVFNTVHFALCPLFVLVFHICFLLWNIYVSWREKKLFVCAFECVSMCV